MKIIFTVLTFFCLTACGEIANSQNNIEYQTNLIEKTPDNKKSKTNKKNLELDNNIISQIRKYYHNEYGEGTEAFEKINDSTIEIYYQNVSKFEEPYPKILASIYIPKKNKISESGTIPIIYGDVNDDNLEDLVITVYTEGAGVAGNVGWDDIFMFLNQDGNLKLHSVTMDKDISGCGGYFYPYKIENSFLIGNSFCYGEEDARCCPSEKYLTKVLLQNDKLVFYTKEKIK